MIHQAGLSLEGLDGATIVRLEGREGMNELGEFTVDLLTDDAELDPASLVGKSAILGLAGATGEQTTFHLVVLHASHRGHAQGEERIQLTLAPPLASLHLRVNHQIFQELTTQEIVTQVLHDAGVPVAKVKWRLAGPYARRTYTVQYGESDWAFVTRLLADEGINHWFDHQGEESLLIFGDHPSSHDGIEGDSPGVLFQDASGMNESTLAFHSLRKTWSITSTRFTLRDIDVQRPAVPIDGEAGQGALELFEYPSTLVLPDAAKARAQVRLEQARRNRQTLLGESANPRLRAGRVIELSGAADEHFSGKFLIVAVEHHLIEASRQDPNGKPYGNRVTLVPFAGEVPHRPAPPERRPIIDGLESAIVTGPPGEEIHVDDLGRVKVRFFWDRSGVRDDKSSRWVRTLQMNLSAPQILPRIGWEVPIVYENGDPDRPFVLGRLYNGGAPPPYGLPGKKATSTLQSATSPSDGTTQEVRLGDDSGGEEAFLHATKDQTVSVGGSHTVEVAANRSDDVKKTQSQKVDASQTTSIGGNQKITVGADGAVAVKGARSESIGGSESIGVTGTYALTVKGGYVEQVGSFYSLRCNHSLTTVQGAFTQVIGASLNVTAGLGSNQSVAGARTEVVGGARSFAAAATYADGTTGVKTITAAAANESAGADMAWTAGARAQVSAGGAISIQGGGKVVFEAASITVKAATLSATGGSTMKLAGGLKSSSTVKLAAPSVKKTKKVEVDG